MPFKINLFPWPLKPWFQWKKIVGLRIIWKKTAFTSGLPGICAEQVQTLVLVLRLSGFHWQFFSLKHLVSVHTSWVLSWVHTGYNQPWKFKCRAQLKQLLSSLLVQTTLPVQDAKIILASWTLPRVWWKPLKPGMAPAWFGSTLLAYFKTNSIS